MKKYKIGTQLIALTGSIFTKDDILTIVKPIEFFSSYTIKTKRGERVINESSGWDPNFIDDAKLFKLNKIDWRQRLK